MTDNPFKNPKALEIGNIFNTPNLKSISYSSFDYFTIKDRVIEYAKNKFGNDFNDFVESSLGIMLIEIWAYIADMLSFKMDMLANEMFIDTVSLRKNINKIAKLVGYPIKNPAPATCRISLTVPAPYSFDLYIPSGYQIIVPGNDGASIYFELYVADENFNPIFNEDIIIPAGSISNLSVVALEGVTISETFNSTGEKNLQVTTREVNVLEQFIEVYVNNDKWTRVDFFTEQDNGLYYRVELNEDYKATIIFSDDIRGKIPPNGSEIRVSYRYGGGERGNISQNYINKTMNVSTTQVPQPIPINIFNYTRGEGGKDEETIDEIKYNLPLWMKAQDRAVTGEDYTILSENFSTLYNGRIGKALAALRNSGCSGNIIDIYVLQLDGTSKLKTANKYLKDQLKTYLSNKKMLTDYLVIKDAAQVFQDIGVNVSINRFYSQFRREIEEQVSQALNDFFKLENWYIGKTLKKQDLVRALNVVSNVIDIDITFLYNNQNLSGDNDNIVVDFWKIIRPGNITINIEIRD